LIDAQKSVRENIIELIASSGARLENEVAMYLNSEISKITRVLHLNMFVITGYSFKL
ncbi:MAG TPA: ATP--cob(I)alamin adenosyltransferase, partial [Eubacterium sp.]|nr:ATP--cob(I)alamin adenosyltransferase [Eubacterium sp.]